MPTALSGREVRDVSPDPDPAPNLAVFDGLYAVIMYASMGGRLRWSPEDHAWRRWSGLYDDWEPTVDPSASPDDDDLGAALALAARHGCWDCGDGPAVHFIEADAFGRPTRYCVRRPSASIVGSSGTKKHWGSPYGCLNSSAHHGQYDEYGRHDGMSAPGGWFLYGEPLAADRVMQASGARAAPGRPATSLPTTGCSAAHLRSRQPPGPSTSRRQPSRSRIESEQWPRRGRNGCRKAGCKSQGYLGSSDPKV